MSLFDAFRYDGKRVLVVGGATGMGAAGAELVLAGGADVVVMDFAEVALEGVTPIQVNLAERASIDAAIDACGGPFHAAFLCAGVADGTPGIERINYVGHRYLAERMLAAGMLARGSAICFISSSAGLGWEPNFPEISELLDIEDFDEAAQWLRDRGKADYMSTKQAVCAFVARDALRFLQHGVRINALCPGPTDTPLARANAEVWLGGGADYRKEAGVEASTAMEQAYPLAFLCSDAASAIAGITLVSDAGWFSAGMTGSYPDATPIASFLYNRPPAYQPETG
jgi:NAD(P)-dependent dehydrogenase (short-subunit alcohol dehydrogenase family)